MNSKINTLWRTGLILGIGLAAGMLPATDKNSSTQVRLVTATIDTRPEAAAFRQSGLAADKITHDLRAIADSEGAPALIPVLIQFEGPLKTEWRRALTEQNIRIIAYIPDNAVLAQAPAGRLDAGAALECVRWMGHLRPEYKIAPGILRPGAAAHPVPLGPDANSPISTDEFRPAYDAGDFITITIRTLSPDAVDAVTAALTRPGGVVLKSARGPRQGTIRASVRPADLAALAAHPQVEWIERYRTPQIQNNVAAGASFMNADIVRTNHGLTGLGQVIGVCDTGLDTGDLNALHPDFTNRVRAAFGLARPGEWSDLMGHGTHVCGSVLGSGSAWSNGLFKGIAPGAELVIQSAGDESSHVFLPADLNDLFIQAYTNAARLHSDSWGDSAAGEYSVYCQQCDEFVWDHPDFLPLFSAGNSGTDADGDGVVDFGSIGAPAAAKNVMAVGAAISDRPAGSGGLSSNKWGENWYTRFPMAPIRDALVSTPYDGIHQGLAAFSSRGPCRDGRIKPDIVAPGTDIISCRSRMPGASELWGTGAGVLANGASNFYAFCGGTSMSTPLVAGAAVLARQYLVENRGIASPGAALIKALMAAGARTLSPGQYGTGAAREIPLGQRPNNHEGWGHINLGDTLFPGGNSTNILVDGLSLSAGQVYSYTYTPSDSNRASIALAWSDYPASPLAAASLVNDLDLAVVTPDHEIIYPNGLSGPDRTNNLELIDLDPAAAGGSYLVLVSAHNVPHGPQPFALVIHESAPKTAALDSLWHSPAPVTGSAPVQVKAAFTSGSAGFQEVLAYYRVDGGTWIGQAMAAEGSAPDRAVYSASIPAQSAGARVEYTIRAIPAAGETIASATNAFTVWNGAIYVSPSGAALPPYDTPARGFKEIQPAVNAAEAGMHILVEAGVYGGATLVITQNLTLQSLCGPGGAILDGSGLRQCISNNSLSVLDGFSIRNGRSRDGGGAFLHGGELRNCVIYSNLAENSGGGVMLEARGRLSGCVIHDNAAGAGGGAACTYGGEMAGCLLQHNAAGVYGGGAAMIFGGGMSNCIIKGNAALTNGGGVVMLNLFGMYSIRMDNCLVVSNAALVEDGGVILGMGGEINNCTIAGNAAPAGAGLYISAIGRVANTIIHGNINTNFHYSSYNASSVQLNNCCLMPAITASDLTVNGQLACDPLFRHPAGGDYRLRANSPCRDAGTNAGWMANVTDLEGNARIINAIVDIGAYELRLPADMWNFASIRNAFADFDGDGKMDPAVYQAASGTWQALLSAGGYRLAGALFGGPQFVPAPGDYDGDRMTDMAVYDTLGGAWYLPAPGGGSAALGGPGDRPAPGDYDGDGKTDPAVFNSGTGQWKALLSGCGYAAATATFGAPGYEPVFGDYDGDGILDPALYNRASGLWSILSSGCGYAQVNFAAGGPACFAAVADFDGDGRADPAVYEESSGVWYAMCSGCDYALAGYPLDVPGSLPVPADYDGDALADPALYRRATGEWIVWPSGSGYRAEAIILGGPGHDPINAAR